MSLVLKSNDGKSDYQRDEKRSVTNKQSVRIIAKRRCDNVPLNNSLGRYVCTSFQIYAAKTKRDVRRYLATVICKCIYVSNLAKTI